MQTTNRISDLAAGRLQEAPSVLTVVDGDGEVILQTLSWEEAKACSDQWVDLGYPVPEIVVRRHS